jgi:hypothetical protein
MTTTLRPGTRVFSAVCTTEMIAIKAPVGEVPLTIGGAPPVASATERDGRSSVSAGHGGGALLGKRYVDAAETVELLCTRAGDGLPALDGELLQVKAAKPLPSSD